MNTNYNILRSLALSAAACAVLSGLYSCQKENGGEDPDKPVSLQDQICYDGGTPVDIKSVIYEVEDTDLFTFYLSPEAGITGTGSLEDAGDCLTVTVRNPSGTVDTEEDEFSISYKDVSVRPETMNDMEKVTLSADLVEQTSVLNLYVEVTMKSGKTLLARYNGSCSEAALAELSNQYEMDGTVNVIGSAVAWHSRPENRTTYYFYTDSGVTEPSEGTAPAFSIAFSRALFAEGTTGATVDLSSAAPADVTVTCGDFTTAEGPVTGTLTLTEEVRSQRNFLVVSLDASKGDSRLRAECTVEYSYGYEAAGTFSVTPSGEDAVTVESDLSKVFFYSTPSVPNVFMFGTAEDPQAPSDLTSGSYAVRLGMLDSQIGNDVVPGTGCSFSLYDYQTYATSNAAVGTEGSVFVDKVGSKTYLYFTVTFADGTLAEGEWYGETVAVEEDTDLTPVEPFSPKITITTPDGELKVDRMLERVEMRRASGNYFFYFVPENTSLEWDIDSEISYANSRLYVPRLKVPESLCTGEDVVLGQLQNNNWEFKFTQSADVLATTAYNYGGGYGCNAEDATVNIIRNDDKTWNIKFTMTDTYSSMFSSGGTGNLVSIEWRGSLTKCSSATASNDYPESDY